MNWFMRLFKRNDKPILLAWGPNNFRRDAVADLFNKEGKLVLYCTDLKGGATWTFHRAFLRSIDRLDPYFSFDCYPTERDTMTQDLKRSPEPFV